MYVSSRKLAARCQRFGVTYYLRFHSRSRLSAKGKIILKYILHRQRGRLSFSCVSRLDHIITKRQKAKLPVYLVEDHLLKICERVNLFLQEFLTSTLDGDGWSVSYLTLLSPGETLHARWIGGWEAPEPVLALLRKKCPLLLGIGSGFPCR